MYCNYTHMHILQFHLHGSNTIMHICMYYNYICMHVLQLCTHAHMHVLSLQSHLHESITTMCRCMHYNYIPMHVLLGGLPVISLMSPKLVPISWAGGWLADHISYFTQTWTDSLSWWMGCRLHHSLYPSLHWFLGLVDGLQIASITHPCPHPFPGLVGGLQVASITLCKCALTPWTSGWLACCISNHTQICNHTLSKHAAYMILQNYEAIPWTN